MLTPTQADRRVTTNITGGESFDMGIDDDARELVFQSLEGLYSDQITAMLREYATNAIDAHKAAGIDRPIEVTLPKPMQPRLTIRDYGVGLDVDDLRNIYSQFGASTKRDSNDYNGMLGFGCKSALAYSDQFTITSVKDGVKTFCSVSKDEDGRKFRVLDTQRTTEPNGTTVEIPMGDRNDQRLCVDKAATLYSYFDKGSVLVDGQAPKPFAFDSQIDDHTWVTKRGQYEYNRTMQSYVVMGNVPYPADIDHGLQDGYAVVVKVPIGAVEFTPSREALKMTKASTKRTIASIEARLHKHFQTIVQREVDAAVNPLDALAVVRKWRAALRFNPNPPTSPLKYRGRAIPDRIEAGPAPALNANGVPVGPTPTFILVGHNSHKLAYHQVVRNITVDTLEDCIWIKNFDMATFTATTKKKMNEWARTRYQKLNVRPPKTWILTSGEPPEFWTDGNVVLDWPTVIKPIKLASATVRTASGDRPTGSYDAYIDGTRTHVKADAIDTTKPLFWTHGNRFEADRYLAVLNAAHPGGYTFVFMALNRVDKFKRDFPGAVGARNACEAAYKAWAASLSLDTRKALGMADACLTDRFNTLGQFGSFDDPAINEAIRIAKIDVKAAQAARRRFRYVVSIDNVGVKVEDPLVRYPLASGSLARRHQDHVRFYLNGAYRAYQRGVLK